MKKQIIYPDFITRIFAMMLDLLFLTLFLTPFMNIFAGYIFIYNFQDFFAHNQIDTSSAEAIVLAMRSPEFMGHITMSKIITYLVSLTFLYIVVMSVYFIGFWYKIGATPGKIIMGMHIVNADDFQKPMFLQLVKRFFGYGLAVFGMWSAIFSKNHRALHDKISHTVVIKK